MRVFLYRFAGFSGLGIVAFIFDFILLAFLKEVAGMHYLRAAGIAFIIATSFHYLAARRIVFKKSSRSYLAGYPYFIAVAIVNLGITLGLMKFAVETIGLYYLLARPLVSSIVGTLNFIINTKLTFRASFFN